MLQPGLPLHSSQWVGFGGTPYTELGPISYQLFCINTGMANTQRKALIPEITRIKQTDKHQKKRHLYVECATEKARLSVRIGLGQTPHNGEAYATV